MPVFRAEWSGLKESLNFIERLGVTAEKFVSRGVGRAAIRTQEIIRENLERMVYSQPPTSNYTRTRTLMRSVHAASPSASHAADETRASGGVDLSASQPDSVVGAEGSVLISEVGSWISYASKVHEGVNQPQPRPFVGMAVASAEAFLGEEVMTAILAEFSTAPHG